MAERIYGAALILKIDDIDYAAEIKVAELEFEDADTDNLTFGDAMTIGDQGKLTITAMQSTDTASFWRMVWANALEKNVPFALAPHGNLTPSATQPHITGTVDIGVRPKIGGQADPKKPYDFEVEWTAKVDKALKVTA